MSADEKLGVMFQGRSPLRYNRAGNIERFAVVNPEAVLPDKPVFRMGSPSHVAETEYWHPQVKVDKGENNRRLKQSKVITNPSAAAPGTVSFADVTASGDDVYINYMNTRNDQRGQGHASRLVEHIAQQYPGTIDFGKVMSPSVWRMKEGLESQGRTTQGHRDF